MKRLVLAVAATLSMSAFAQDTLVRDGATCDISEGYNSAPYSAEYNSRGMSEFCVFPAQPWVDAFTKLLDGYTPPDLPECADGLVIGPAVPVYPCYEVIED